MWHDLKFFQQEWPWLWWAGSNIGLYFGNKSRYIPSCFSIGKPSLNMPKPNQDMLPSYLPGLPHPFLCIFGILAIFHEPPHQNAGPRFCSKALCGGLLVVFRSLAFHGTVATLFVFLYYLGILAIFPELPPQFAQPSSVGKPFVRAFQWY